MIVELGTGVGISTIYLASGSPGTPLHSIEGDTDRAALGCTTDYADACSGTGIHSLG